MSNFVAEINKLKNIQHNFENNEMIATNRLTKLDEYQQIVDLHSELSTARNVQKEQLQKDMSNIIRPLRKVKDSIKQKDFEGIDLKVIKQEMTSIQNNIYNQKQFTRESLELLQKDEDKLIKDLEIFDQKIQDWNKPNSNKTNMIKRTSSIVPENIAPAVKEFMEYVTANGGHENGWSSDDHNLFLKYRNKIKNLLQLAEGLNSVLPDISKEEIIAHEQWYAKYVELKEKQKTSIKNWRDTKPKPDKPPKVIVKEQKIIINSYNDVLKREAKQLKIIAWKTEKRTELRTQREKQLVDQRKKKQIDVHEEERRKVLRVELDDWKRAKHDVVEAEKIKKEIAEIEERRNRSARANKLIKHFQKQDETFVKQKRLANGCRPKSSSEALPVPHKEAPRDPERLLKPTKQWLLRSYGGSSELHKSQSTLRVQEIPKLCTPEWRKSIM